MAEQSTLDPLEDAIVRLIQSAERVERAMVTSLTVITDPDSQADNRPTGFARTPEDD